MDPGTLEEFSALGPSTSTNGRAPEFLVCPPEERAEALGILYGRASRVVRPRLVADLMLDAAEGRIDLSGLWVVRRRGRVIGAFLTQRLAGRAAAVWPPEVRAFLGRSDLAAALIGAAVDDLKLRGFRVIQAVVDPGASGWAPRVLALGGLPRITDLVYLARSTVEPLDFRRQAPCLDWCGFGPETEGEFRSVLQESYAGSLDMPELEGARTLDDVLAGHREGGRFDPDRWRVGRLPGSGEPVAVVLLTTHPDRDAWEVSYLGLIPSARGIGLGRVALAHALDRARPCSPRLELAVDVRNRPAERLYRGAGFMPFDRRSVHLALL